MGPGPICLNQMELRVHLYEVYLEVRGLHPTGSWKWRVSDDKVLGKQIIRFYLCELFPFMIVLNFQIHPFSGQCQAWSDSSGPTTERVYGAGALLPGNSSAFK